MDWGWTNVAMQTRQFLPAPRELWNKDVQGFLFRVLEATDEQQEVLLLINQGFSKALCSQITQVQLFHLKEKKQ